MSVTASDTDWQKINKQFAEQRERMINEYRKQYREINDMLTNERKDVQTRYKEYDGCNLGYYVQWFFCSFFVVGFAVVVGIITLAITLYYCK